ncbi:MAG: hypothetical protein QME76_09860 [Bacillota bacterium]|nr:hypothetical protein [Bacillota bacterium]
MRSVWLWLGAIALWVAVYVWVVVIPGSWTSYEVYLVVEVALVIGMHVLLGILALKSKQKILVYILGLVINGLLFFALFCAVAITWGADYATVYEWIASTLVSSIVYTIIVCAFLAVANYMNKRKLARELTSEDKRD